MEFIKMFLNRLLKPFWNKLIFWINDRIKIFRTWKLNAFVDGNRQWYRPLFILIESLYSGVRRFESFRWKTKCPKTFIFLWIFVIKWKFKDLILISIAAPGIFDSLWNVCMISYLLHNLNSMKWQFKWKQKLSAIHFTRPSKLNEEKKEKKKDECASRLN